MRLTVCICRTGKVSISNRCNRYDCKIKQHPFKGWHRSFSMNVSTDNEREQTIVLHNNNDYYHGNIKYF